MAAELWSELWLSRWTSALTTAAEISRIKRGEAPGNVSLISHICKWMIFILLNVHSDLQAGAKLVLNRHFADEHWTKNRVVTCLDWSPQVRDSVSQPPNWLKKSPEYD